MAGTLRSDQHKTIPIVRRWWLWASWAALLVVFASVVANAAGNITIGMAVALALLFVGMVLALLFDLHAIEQLRHLLRHDSVGQAAVEKANRNRGEMFERTWQGSQGWDRPAEQWPKENWTSRMVIAEFTVLRPSRFNDPSYWRRYLPGIMLIRVVLFFVLPLLIGANLGGVPFTPTQTQRATPDTGQVAEPPACPSSANASGTAARLSYTDDGNVVTVHPGDVVSVSYLYQRPSFSKGTPLCSFPGNPASGVARFVATGAGSGYVYLPQPNGAVVAKIEVTSIGGIALLALLVALLVLVGVGLSIWTWRLATRSRRT